MKFRCRLVALFLEKIGKDAMGLSVFRVQLQGFGQPAQTKRFLAQLQG
jgi:hypothetical protein